MSFPLTGRLFYPIEVERQGPYARKRCTLSCLFPLESVSYVFSIVQNSYKMVEIAEMVPTSVQFPYKMATQLRPSGTEKPPPVSRWGFLVPWALQSGRG